MEKISPSCLHSEIFSIRKEEINITIFRLGLNLASSFTREELRKSLPFQRFSILMTNAKTYPSHRLNKRISEGMYLQR
jgi:hypothetical protein